jgi:Cu-processing system permease protein
MTAMTAFAIEPRQIGIIAAKEFRDRIRNRWVLAVTMVLTAFALVIAYFGSASQGAIGFRGIEVTIASLVSLVIYLVPLIALILGFDAIVGERERGSLDLLLSMPLTRFELLLGKFLGLSAALACATIAGFGLVGVLLGFKMPLAAWYHYAGFILSSVLLGMPLRCGSSLCWSTTCCCWAPWSSAVAQSPPMPFRFCCCSTPPMCSASSTSSASMMSAPSTA